MMCFLENTTNPTPELRVVYKEEWNIPHFSEVEGQVSDFTVAPFLAATGWKFWSK